MEELSLVLVVGAVVARDGDDMQVQIPVIQKNDDAQNQIQQNINKVFRNLNSQILSIQESINSYTIIGEIKLAGLTLAQFQSVTGTNWILSNGQSCVGTEYALLTLNNVVPNISVTNATAFIRVN